MPSYSTPKNFVVNARNKIEVSPGKNTPETTISEGNQYKCDPKKISDYDFILRILFISLTFGFLIAFIFKIIYKNDDEKRKICNKSILIGMGVSVLLSLFISIKYDCFGRFKTTKWVYFGILLILIMGIVSFFAPEWTPSLTSDEDFKLIIEESLYYISSLITFAIMYFICPLHKIFSKTNNFGFRSRF
tara:strand:+ start:252 stop:818 length:567 start_codon:yes stop_codon:yes gene_type:complete